MTRLPDTHPTALYHRRAIRPTYAFGAEMRGQLPAFCCASIYEAARDRGAPPELCDRPLGLITSPDPPEVEDGKLVSPTLVGLMCLRTGQLLLGEPGWWPSGEGVLIRRERVLARRGDAKEGSKQWKATRPPRTVLHELHITRHLDAWTSWWAAETWTPAPERFKAACMLWCGDAAKMRASAERIARPCDVRVVEVDEDERGEVAA